MIILGVLYPSDTMKMTDLPNILIQTAIDLFKVRQVVKHKKVSKTLPRWWIPLPLVLVIMTSTSMDHILINDIIVKRYQRKFGVVDAPLPSFADKCVLSNSSTIGNLIQEKTAHLNVLLGGASVGPAMITLVLLGANCDHIGRRPLMLIPFIGKVIYYTLLMAIVKLNLDDGWLIATNAIESVFGSSPVMLLGVVAYISDCTTEKTRSHAFLVQEVAAVLSRTLPLLGLGFWLRAHNYVFPVSINLSINAAALLYAIFIQPESRVHETIWRQLKRLRLTPVLHTYRVFLVKRDGHHQQLLILLTVAQTILFLMSFGFVSIRPLYLYGRPFCFDALKVAILTSSRQ
jgi:hypothetical protein